MTGSDPPSSDLQAEIEALEQAEAAAMLAADVAALEKFWSEDLMVNSTANIVAGKDMLLDLIRLGHLRLKTYQRKTMKLTELGDVVVVTGNETSQFDSDVITDYIYCSYMNVWKRVGDDRKMIARHVGLISRTPA
jgi:ketosteroid isomerase-like protein